MQWGDTALILAAENGHKDIVDELLRSNIDLNKANKVSEDNFAFRRQSKSNHMVVL